MLCKLILRTSCRYFIWILHTHSHLLPYLNLYRHVDMLCRYTSKYSSMLNPHIIGKESKPCIFDFHIFQERQKTEQLLLGVSYIAESTTR